MEKSKKDFGAAGIEITNNRPKYDICVEITKIQ